MRYILLKIYSGQIVLRLPFGEQPLGACPIQIHICIFSLQKDIVIQCRKRVVTPVLSTIEDRIIRGGGKKWVRKIFETSEKFVGMSGGKSYHY